MSVFSFQFVLAVILLSAGFFYLPGVWWRRLAFTACNVVFIRLCFPDAVSLIPLAVFVVSGYGVAVTLRKRPSSALLGAYLTALVAAFMVLKKYVFLQPLLPAQLWLWPVSTIGLSYLLFRQIHFLVDMMQQQIEDVSLPSYVNYQLNFLGFLSGPIQRYQDFEPTWRQWKPVLNNRHDIMVTFLRLYAGLVKIAISTWIFGIFAEQRDWFLNPAKGMGVGRVHVLLKFALMFYAYPVYLYFNFSGYCDVVIAGAALLGVQLPENFDRPYLSRNMLDYWTRFHRSLGFWIRDYLFMPLYKAVAERWNSQAAPLVFPCYFVAFVLAGVWHGSTLNFLVFGILHGCGVSVVKLWEFYIVKRRGRKGLKEYLASQPIRFAAIALTLNFVSFTMLFFPHDVSVTRAILSSFWHRVSISHGGA
jgi:D-alanyl-lipoteichoic acid acyltransferase DltB (MBOAT superfamily)